MPRSKSPSRSPPSAEWTWGLDLAAEVKRELRRRMRGSGRSEAELALQLGFGRTFFANLFQQPTGRDPISLRIEVLLATARVLGIDAAEVLRAAQERGAPPAPSGADPDAGLWDLASAAERLTTEDMTELGREIVERMGHILKRRKPAKPGPVSDHQHEASEASTGLAGEPLVSSVSSLTGSLPDRGDP